MTKPYLSNCTDSILTDYLRTIFQELGVYDRLPLTGSAANDYLEEIDRRLKLYKDDAQEPTERCPYCFNYYPGGGVSNDPIPELSDHFIYGVRG